MSSNKGAWVEEFRYQISLAENTWKSSIDGKGRIAFVLLDNVIEFMSKCYLKVVRGLVGKGKKQINPTKWFDISRHFDELIGAMRIHSPIPPSTLDSVEQNHLNRNDLYHTSTPMEVPPKLFATELGNAIEIFETLFNESFTSSIIDVDSVFHGKPALETLFSTVGGQHVRVDYRGSWALSQWIRVIIYGYVRLGITPIYDQIEHSLAISNQATEESKIRGALRKLRFDHDISENTSSETYSLTEDGLDRTMKQR